MCVYIYIYVCLVASRLAVLLHCPERALRHDGAEELPLVCLLRSLSLQASVYTKYDTETRMMITKVSIILSTTSRYTMITCPLLVHLMRILMTNHPESKGLGDSRRLGEPASNK